MTSPVQPQLPLGTPVWLVRLIALAFAAVPTILVVWQPGNTFSTAAAQAAVVLVGYLIAGLILAIHFVMADVKAYGWTRLAAAHIESDAESELKTLLPEARTLVSQAQPVLALGSKIAEHDSTIAALASQVTDLTARASQTPGVDRAVVETTVRQVLASLTPAAVTSPAPPAV